MSNLYKKKSFCFLMTLVLILMSFSVSGSIINEESTEIINKIDTLSLGTTLFVGGSGSNNYSKIQDAINDSVDGDTVFVYSGMYQETLVINTSIFLIGEDKVSTIIDGNMSYLVVEINTDDVCISGFTLTDLSGSYSYYGIQTAGNNTIIDDNIISDLGRGVFIAGSTGNLVSNNDFLKSGVILSTLGTSEASFVGNTVNEKPLEYLDAVSDMVIDWPVGQLIMRDCENVSIVDQDIKNTPIGIQMQRCMNCVVSNCDIVNCYDCAVSISNSEDCCVVNSVFERCYNFGIYISNSENITVEHNNIILNQFAVMCEYAKLCTFIDNNFANNFFFVISLFGTLNKWSHNYWNRARVFPKVIIEFPRISIDRNPAKERN